MEIKITRKNSSTIRNNQLDAYLSQLDQEYQIKPNEFTEDLELPADIAAGLLVGRGSMIRGIKRSLNPDECAAVCKCIAVLVETNRGLQLHAQEVSRLVKEWQQHLRGMEALAQRVEAFADFQPCGDESDE